MTTTTTSSSSSHDHDHDQRMSSSSSHGHDHDHDDDAIVIAKLPAGFALSSRSRRQRRLPAVPDLLRQVGALRVQIRRVPRVLPKAAGRCDVHAAHVLIFRPQGRFSPAHWNCTRLPDFERCDLSTLAAKATSKMRCSSASKCSKPRSAAKVGQSWQPPWTGRRETVRRCCCSCASTSAGQAQVGAADQGQQAAKGSTPLQQE